MKHKRRNELRYPGLWRGCVGAWNPGLGPTGLTLRDWSGFCRHGTLTNMDAGSDWVPSGGQYALDFDGTNDYISLSSSAMLDGGNKATISVFVNPRTVGGGYRAIFYISTGGGSNNFILQMNNIDNTVRFYINPALVQTTQSLAINNWTHVAATYDGAIMTIYLNGVAVQSGIKTGNITDMGIAKNIGRYEGDSQYFPGLIADTSIYNRTLSTNEIRLLSSRRGIAYELAPRRRSSVLVNLNLNNLMMGSSF